MAILSIVEKARGQVGGKAFRAFEITVASTVANYVTVTAASCGMNDFDHVMVQGATMTSANAGDWFLSTCSGPYIDMLVTQADADDQFELWAIGT